MMNVFALGLLFTSLVTSGFFSPTPEKQNSKENIVLKDGHKVVVEFEKDNGNTKVSISPQDYDKGFLQNMEEKVSDSAIPEEIHRGFSPRELVCDAYGKCKYKIAAAMGKTKDAVAEKAHEVEEEAGDSVHRVSDMSRESTEEIHRGFSPRELVCDAYGKCRYKIAAAMGKTKDAVAEKAHEVEEEAADSVHRVSDISRESTETVKDKASEKVGEMREGAEKAKDRVSEKVKEAEEMVEDASDRVKQGTRSVLERTRDVGVRFLAMLVPPVSLNWLSGVLHLMGFAVAYGMCVWVTFASSYVLAVALPRHQFGMVQSKIYPVYFKALAYCVAVALFGHLLSQRRRLSPLSVGMFQASNLVVSLAMVLANLLYLEPRATKVMFERMKKEKEEGRGKESDDTGRNIDPITEPLSSTGWGSAEERKQTDGAAAAKAEMARLSEMLRRLNSYSSLLNILTLMCLTCHLVYLGQRLHIEC